MTVLPYTYSFHIDTRRDGTFGAGIDDITALVEEANWSLGMRQPMDNFAPPAECRLVLKNTTLDFLPDHTIGGEVLTNGSFATWSSGIPTGWTRTGHSAPTREVTQVSPSSLYGGGGSGAANFYKNNSTTDLYLSQTTLTVGYTYRLRLNVTALAEGSVLIARCNGVTVLTAAKIGLHEAYFNAEATSLEISAQSANCNITIDDVSVQRVGLYSQLIRPGTLVRVRITYSGTTRQMWIGKVDADGVRFDPNPYEDPKSQVVMVTARDTMLNLLAADYAPPLMTNARVDQVIQRVFDDGVTGWPYARSGWIIEGEGASELGLTTRLAPAAPVVLDTAQTTLTYVGDNADRGGGVNPQGYLRNLVDAELDGRLFWSRDGAYTFHSRARDPLNLTVAATITDPVRVKFDHGGDLANSVTVNFVAKDLGTPLTVLWANKTPLKIGGGSTRSFTARYSVVGQEDRRIGAINVLAPVRNYDLIASTDEAGTVATDVDISTEIKATSAKITLTNRGSADIYVQRLQIRGTPLISYDDEITLRNANSIFAYDERPMAPRRLQLVDDENLARAYAEWLINRMATGTTRITEAELNASLSTAHAAAGHASTVGSRVTLTNAYLNHSADYIIVGERHVVDWPTGSHQITWILKPCEKSQTWITDHATYGVLNSTTLLGL